jgi:large subunit ribosomal protein L28
LLKGSKEAALKGWYTSVFDPERKTMAKQCEVCGKKPVVGRQASHANNVTARRFEPNLQRIRAVVNGASKYMRVCTRCIRSNKVTKAA